MNTDVVARALLAAYRDELAAVTPGTARRSADGRSMTAADVVSSAEAAVPALIETGAPVGRRILNAVEASRAGIGAITGLGILLLCAPLAAACEQPGPAPLRERISTVLTHLDRSDAEDTCRALTLAEPSRSAVVQGRFTLKQAMLAEAGRDRIALQYASNYTDLFVFGLPALVRGLKRAARSADTAADAFPLATTSLFLGFMSAFPDSHIVRTHGPEAARSVMADARRLLGAGAAFDPTRHREALLAFDADLRARDLDPLTTADLTVATLFLARLGAAAA